MKATSALLFAAASAAGSLFGTNGMASEIDERIESAFKKTYAYKTYLKDDAIKIDSTDSRVTLTGTVAVDSHKSLAKETAEGLPGVRSVDNRLEVKGDRPSENSDAWIRMKVHAALLFHRNVNAGKTDVEVVQGVVILRGDAESMAQKELTAEYAKDVVGVREVKNEMTVVKAVEKPSGVAEDIDDASITAQVKTVLLAHRSTSALRTEVTTKNGVVTVSGRAKNAAEKSLASKLINDVHGVKSVENEMTID